MANVLQTEATMANSGLLNKDVVETVMAEMKPGDFADALGIVSVITNRANELGVSPKDVVSIKSEFNGYGTGVGKNKANRDMVQAAIEYVSQFGPAHKGTFYARETHVDNLPKGLKETGYQVQPGGHVYFEDPQNRAIYTAQGLMTPKSARATEEFAALDNVPIPSPAPRQEQQIAQIAPPSIRTGPGAREANMFDVMRIGKSLADSFKPSEERQAGMFGGPGTVERDPRIGQPMPDFSTGTLPVPANLGFFDMMHDPSDTGMFSAGRFHAAPEGLGAYKTVDTGKSKEAEKSGQAKSIYEGAQLVTNPLTRDIGQYVNASPRNAPAPQGLGMLAGPVTNVHSNFNVQTGLANPGIFGSQPFSPQYEQFMGGLPQEVQYQSDNINRANMGGRVAANQGAPVQSVGLVNGIPGSGLFGPANAVGLPGPSSLTGDDFAAMFAGPSARAAPQQAAMPGRSMTKGGPPLGIPAPASNFAGPTAPGASFRSAQDIGTFNAFDPIDVPQQAMKAAQQEMPAVKYAPQVIGPPLSLNKKDSEVSKKDFPVSPAIAMQNLAHNFNPRGLLGVLASAPRGGILGAILGGIFGQNPVGGMLAGITQPNARQQAMAAQQATMLNGAGGFGPSSGMFSPGGMFGATSEAARSGGMIGQDAEGRGGWSFL